MTNNLNNSKYNLEERTARFGEEVIIFCRLLKADHISKPLISQLIRSATSIGANYMEANGASSKSDFRNKIYISKKEAQETKHWFRMLLVTFPDQKDVIDKLWKESQELTLIFSKIVSSLKIK
jgi:four helix bundle protein